MQQSLVGLSRIQRVGIKDSLKVGQTLSIEAGETIELVCGSSKIVLTPSAIHLDSPTIHILGGSAVNIDGGSVNINCGAASGASPEGPDAPDTASLLSTASPVMAAGLAMFSEKEGGGDDSSAPESLAAASDGEGEGGSASAEAAASGDSADLPALSPVSMSANDDGSYVAQLSVNISIEGSKEFVKAVINDLEMLNGTPTGNSLISTIMQSDQPVRIIETSGGNSARANRNALLRDDGTVGVGSPTTVNYNPNRKVIGDGTEDWMTRPPIVGLGHELVHVDQMQNGRLDRRIVVDGTKNSELEAVGLGDFADALHTENKIRAELGEPLRPRY